MKYYRCLRAASAGFHILAVQCWAARGATNSEQLLDGTKHARIYRNANIDALVVIGGNGSQAGAQALSQLGLPVAGVASTIDNDLCGTDLTIGVDTALNIALEAIDRLKTTASSHHRAFLVEVMGRNCGYLGLMAGLAGGADAIVVPEIESDPEAVATELRDAYDRGKSHALVVVAEGSSYNAERLNAYFDQHRDRLRFQLRVTKLGHVQRGGAPTAFDRILATRLGAAAVDYLFEGEKGVLVGMQGARDHGHAVARHRRQREAAQSRTVSPRAIAREIIALAPRVCMHLRCNAVGEAQPRTAFL